MRVLVRSKLGIKCPEEMQILILTPTLSFLTVEKLKLTLKCVLTEHVSHSSPTTALGSYE